MQCTIFSRIAFALSTQPYAPPNIYWHILFELCLGIDSMVNINFYWVKCACVSYAKFYARSWRFCVAIELPCVTTVKCVRWAKFCDSADMASAQHKPGLERSSDYCKGWECRLNHFQLSLCWLQQYSHRQRIHVLRIALLLLLVSIVTIGVITETMIR